MTISPPANVKLSEGEAGRVLCSGFDTIVLAIDVEWKTDTFFLQLDELKELARLAEKDTPFELYDSEGQFSAVSVRPHGGDGYEWLVAGREFALKIGNWMTPKSRPSIMAELRSEALWHQGPEKLVERLLSMLAGVDAQVKAVKVSRVDPCLDMMLPKSTWTPDLHRHRVTRSRSVATYEAHDAVTGFALGKGSVSARLYDKPLEIITKSNKVWMFDIWGTGAAGDGQRIIRIEFQVRREALKELGIDTFADLIAKGSRLWAYCTESWLKFQDDPTKHHTQQTTLPFWQLVQRGFGGGQAGNPLVRLKAIKADRQQLLRQWWGSTTSLLAVDTQGEGLEFGGTYDMMSYILSVVAQANQLGMDDKDAARRALAKLGKYRRPVVVSGESPRALADEWLSSGSKGSETP